MRFLGDIHGEFSVLYKTLKKYPNDTIVQVGDMGLGFNLNYDHYNHKTGLWEVLNGNADPEKMPPNFHFVRGNHDSPQKSQTYPNYLGDYGYNKQLNLFYVSGGYSIDKDSRKIGIDWWPDEELDYHELTNAINLYDETKPEMVVSHECPARIQKMITNNDIYGFSRTALALEEMLQIHKPKYWIFGHYHKVWRKTISGTTFICAAINQVISIN